MEINLFTLTIGGFLAISALLDYAYFTYYFQLKEYRVDRFRDFLSTDSGRAFLFDYRMLWRGVIVAVLYALVGDLWSPLVFLFIVLVLEALSKGVHVLKRQVRRPVFTLKAMLIVAFGLAFETLIFWKVAMINIVLLVLVFRFFIAGFAMLLMAAPSVFAKSLYISAAKRKIAQYPNLKIIGITGSYGKSSTKEFLSQILAGKFKVVKTPKNTNTEIGVAKFIAKTDFSNAEVFVVEMGAYTMGEIKKICDITPPTVGILTAIAPQHLSLFGSIRNVQKTKYELLRALPQTGLAITNVDNEYCRELLGTLDCGVRTYGSDPEYSPDVCIEDFRTVEDGVNFTVTTEGETRQPTFPVLGKHNVFNVIAAAIAAKQLGMTRDEIDAAIKTLIPGHGSVTLAQYGKATLINDSYNSNPDGFKAALEILNSFPSNRKRIVVTRGMLELGDQTQELHEQIGGEISFVADELVIINRDFAKYLSHGVVHKYKTDVHHIYDPKMLVEYLRGYKDEDVVILLENRMPSAVYKELNISKSA